MYFFASDVHLGSGTKEQARLREVRFVSWLEELEQNPQCEGLILCGDIFDFWFEYSQVVPKGFTKVFAQLSRLTSRGIKVYFMIGNHDLWMEDYLEQECGVQILRAPCRLKLGDNEVFVAHGDNLNVDNNWKVKALNCIFRSRTAKFVFSWLVHPNLAMRFGRWWSAKSRKSHGEKPNVSRAREAFLKFVRLKEAEQHSDYYIFGHLHHLEYIDNENLGVVFLNDWSTDAHIAMLDNRGQISLQRV